MNYMFIGGPLNGKVFPMLPQKTIQFFRGEFNGVKYETHYRPVQYILNDAYSRTYWMTPEAIAMLDRGGPMELVLHFLRESRADVNGTD